MIRPYVFLPADATRVGDLARCRSPEEPSIIGALVRRVRADLRER